LRLTDAALSAEYTAPASETKATPEESLETSYRLLRDALANELLDRIKNGTQAAFEKIVVDLLVAMGYGGSVEDAGKVAGKSGDGRNRRHHQVKTSWAWISGTSKQSGGRM
jgi:restriction system protein